MALIQNLLPPSRENWEWAVYLFTFFPVIPLIQWLQYIGFLPAWYPAGKTSNDSRFNIPGRIAWVTMEAPGFLTLLYVMNTLPAQLGLSELPWENKIMGSLVVVHYLYRAILAPLIAPSMSPIHPLVWALALSFQLFNGLSLGGWLGGYGPTSRLEWSNYEANYKVEARMTAGMIIWALGFFGNVYHDDVLREIRRAALRNQKKRAQEQDKSTGKGKEGAEKKGVDKVYMIPENGLFWWILYPHYLCEWIEWGGFYIMGGVGCVPARNFLVNEIVTMLPRALDGKKWYEKRFGKAKLEGRKAIIPGIW